MKRALAVCILLGACLAHGQWTAEESAGIDRLLRFWNFDRKELRIVPPLGPDRYRLAAVDAALAEPIGSFDAVGQWAGWAMQTEDLGLRFYGLLPQAPLRAGLVPVSVSVSPADLPPSVPEAAREPVARAAALVLEARRLTALALEGIRPEDREALVRSLPAIAAESEAVPPGPGEARLLLRSEAFGLLDRVAWEPMHQAAARLESARAALVRDLQEAFAKGAPAQVLTFQVGGLTVIVGTARSDRYNVPANALCIDPGGDDVYVGRPGAGMAGVGLAIDLGGSDQFDLGDFGGGAGVLGVGALWDVGGHDRFFGRTLTFGAALGGFGTLWKDGGHDSYRSLALSQGFGMFGVGLLQDTRGDDRYHVGLFGQGAARTAGVGVLSDLSGNDVYTAGGVESGAPLVPQSWQCFAQGAACGYREDSGGASGGIGLLVDAAGDDAYSAGTYSQGASYWFSIGVLWDKAGHDSYSAHYYSQASAMHLCAAYLVDEAGNDAYTVRTGAMHAIGHDYGLAVLLDRSGNDVYAGSDSRPGIGSANGVGLFVDAAGDDRYQGPPAVAAAARDSGSVGLFADLGGQDLYARGLSDGSVRLEPQWAAALDAEGVAAASPAAQAPERPKPGSKPDPGPEELERLFRTASGWGVGTQADAVRQATDELIAIGKPALEWMLREKLASADRLSLRAFEAVIGALKPAGGAMLAPYLSSAKSAERENAWRLARSQAVPEAATALDAGLADPKTRLSAVGWAGATRAESAVPRLVEWAGGDDRTLALACLAALRSIGSPEAIPALRKLAVAEDLGLRKAAVAALARFPDEALSLGTALQQRGLREQRIGIELLAAAGTDAALALVVSALDSAKPELRLEAVRCLAEVDPARYRAQIARLAEDPDPDVRLAVRWALGKTSGR